ncbi:16286_t:CDS:1, partial [Rhizophagus irregularis]
SFKDTKRLKDENRRTDEKETGEKRLIPETPSPTRFLKNIEKYKKRLKQQ